jgi:pyridoxamine 5'-phosphate oxidase family protein
MSFTEEDVSYLHEQRLARLATVDPQGQPDVVPVGFDFDGSDFYIGGLHQTATRKYQNVNAGNTKVALVIDDLAPADPWAPRFLRVYGTADIVEREGYAGPGLYLRIRPAISWSGNLGGRPFDSGSQEQSGPRRTVHQPTP